MNHQHSDTIKTGLVFLSGLALLIYGIFFLKRADIFKKNYTFFVFFENANGLSKGDPVLLKGIRVGKITSLDIVKDQVLVSFDFPKNIPLPEDSRVSSNSQGIIGGKALEIELGKASVFFEKGDTLALADQNSDLTKMLSHYSEIILSKAVPITDKVDVLLTKFNYGADTLLVTLNNLKHIIQNNEKNIQNILNNLNSLSNTTQNTTLPKLNQGLENFEKLTKNLAVLTQNITQNQKPNTLNSLFYSNDLHQKIVDLLTDVKANPERYINISVFGKQSAEVKYKQKIEEQEMKKKWEDYKIEQKNKK